MNAALIFDTAQWLMILWLWLFVVKLRRDVDHLQEAERKDAA